MVREDCKGQKDSPGSETPPDVPRVDAVDFIDADVFIFLKVVSLLFPFPYAFMPPRHGWSW